jgi:hypothetical protein
VTKDGSLGRSGIWKSMTLSRHDAAISAALPSFSPMTADQKSANGLTNHGGRRGSARKKNRRHKTHA